MALLNIETSSPLRCAVLTHQLYKDGKANTPLIERLATDDLIPEFRCFAQGNPSVDFAKTQYGFPHTADPSLGILSDEDLEILLSREQAYRKQKQVSRALIEIADQVGKEPWQNLQSKLASLNASTETSAEAAPLDFSTIYAARKNRAKGTLTGIKPIDDVIAGLEPGTLTTFFAYVSQYKTLTLTNVAYIAATLGYNTCFNTLEVPREFMYFSFLARHSFNPKFIGRGEAVDVRAMRKNQLTSQQEEFIKTIVEPDFLALPGKIHILERGALADYTAVEFDRWCRASKCDIDIYALDYIQLLMGGRDPYDVGNAYTDEAKNIALGTRSDRMRISMMASQANRDGYARAVDADGRYDMRAVAELNRIERSSDNVISTFADETLRGCRECKVQLHKHRGGELIETPVGVKVDPRYSCIGHGGQMTSEITPEEAGSLLCGIPGLTTSSDF